MMTILAAFVIATFTGCERAASPAAGSSKVREASSAAGAPHDWDFLVGSWTVKHRRLKARLAGSTEWEEFNGTSILWLTLGGAGTLDDNVLELPGGTYRAVGIRAYDPKLSRWSIWWLDERHPTTIEPPVMGGFKEGVGTFVGDDTLNGRPIKVRFRWSQITATSAHWEQAFSPDGGTTWEINWVMEFTRAGS
ncbi:MAG TPA: hypothetical protein VK550_19485 [Polyangiaceae bacterium]|nr:hypothetical protein [Polyangiaceae bacterium]